MPKSANPAVLRPCQYEKLARGAQDKEHAMSQKLNAAIAVIGIDIGKNSFHIVGHDHPARRTIIARVRFCSAHCFHKPVTATPLPASLALMYVPRTAFMSCQRDVPRSRFFSGSVGAVG